MLGILQRSRVGTLSRVRAGVIPNTLKVTLHGAINATVKTGATIYTDRYRSYRTLSGYDHHMIDHALEYVNGRIHTNGIEGFWSQLKRSIKGTYISVEPFHLDRYVDEQVCRFNNRKLNDSERFQEVMSRAVGRRLTYEKLCETC